MAVSEDDIIRRRLLYDGDGTGEEKRITTILKTIIKWSTADFDDEERNLTYQKIVALLRQCEYSMTKHHLAYLMNTEERDNYEKLYQQIQEKIVEAKKDIALCKEELQQAKIIRRNKQEYDSLARIIEKHPERKITEREIQSLEKEISELNARMHKLMQKLEMRQKQFHVLVYSVQLLQQILEDDDDGSESSSSHTKQSDVRTPIEVMDLT